MRGASRLYVAALLAVAISTTVGAQPRDSTRVDIDRLVIEPLGASFQLPSAWIDPDARPISTTNCIALRGHSGPRIYTNRLQLPILQRPAGELDLQFGVVADSTFPFSAAVAHMGDERWGQGGSCHNDLQVRVYVSRFAEDDWRQLLSSRGKDLAERFAAPATVSSDDLTAPGWRATKLTWFASLGDYSGSAHFELYTRTVRGRMIAIVFMHAGEEGAAQSHIAPARDLILSSFSVNLPLR
jgi:hypothetical protein